MRIALTGVPGVGKTSVASGLAQLDRTLTIRSVLSMAEWAQCIGEFDEECQCHEIDVEGLYDHIKRKDMTGPKVGHEIVEGHLAHLLPVAAVIVLRVAPKVLEKRLTERGYSQEKVRENLEAEAMDLITQEAVGKELRTFEVDATLMSLEEVTSQVFDLIKALDKNNVEVLDRYEPGKIDWSEEIMKWY